MSVPLDIIIPIVEQHVTDNGVVVIDKITFPEDPSRDKMASNDGSGTLEMLEVITLLEEAGIVCYMVGIAALRYYGASRVFEDWELCVPNTQLQKATQLISSHSEGQIYELCTHTRSYFRSVYPLFPLFKLKGICLKFHLLPSDACHLDCTAADIERSKMGLPYPKLAIFAQSLLDTMSDVALTDLVDGMDLDDNWAADNLNLSGTQDTKWAEETNDKILASRGGRISALYRTEPCSLKEFWGEIVQTKQERIGPEYPPGFLITRFRAAGSGDPRLIERSIV